MTRDEKLAKWGSGPWLDEPDHVQFESHGFPAIIHRNAMGAWCGYVGVPPTHPFHNVEYSGHYAETENGDDGEYIASPVGDLDVHGGVTYAEACQGEICHAAKPGEPDDVWWIGFDCAHSGDLCPSMQRNYGYGSYKDVGYVQGEVAKLAEQLRAAAVVP